MSRADEIKHEDPSGPVQTQARAVHARAFTKARRVTEFPRILGMQEETWASIPIVPSELADGFQSPSAQPNLLPNLIKQRKTFFLIE